MMNFQDIQGEVLDVQLTKGDTKEVDKFKKWLDRSTDTSSPTHHVVSISPIKALVMLERNTENNRPINMRRIHYYAEEMRNGRWEISTDAIGFSQSGKLINGQHRLIACRQAEASFESSVLFGLPDDAFMKVDQGAKRSMSNIFHTSGMKNSAIGASAATFLYAYENDFIRHGTDNWIGGVRGAISPQALFDFLKDHPRFEEAVMYGRSLYDKAGRANRGILSPSMIAGLWYVCMRKSFKQANDFFQHLVVGTEITDDDVLFRLRDRLASREKSGQTIRNRFKAAYVIKVWNGIRKGGDVRYLHWGKKEPFPKAE